MKIDFHTHCFPEKIAEKAMNKLARASGGLVPQTDGTLAGLRREMKADGIDKSVIMNIATNEKQMTAVNDFAASVAAEDIIPFGSVFPGAENVFEELERIKALGLKGVKFHPEYQGFYVDDASIIPVYKKISELGLITLFHAGKDIGFPPPWHGTPERFAGILKYFDSPVVLAHWGGCYMGEEVLKHLAGTDVYFDTSFGYYTMPKAIAQQITDKHGPDKILLGSDMPWQRPSWALALLNSLDISDTDREKIEHINAEKLLGI